MEPYDFERCDGNEALKTVISIINHSGYELVSVTQHEHIYTVFFRRPADG